MRTTLIAYLSTAVVFLAVDFVWLSTMSAALYKPRLGNMLLETPNLTVAGGFYLLYLVGVVAFAVLPALEQGDWVRALWGGALLGLVAYATYDLTNLATLVGWSTFITVVDLVWGSFITALAAVAGYFITRAF